MRIWRHPWLPATAKSQLKVAECLIKIGLKAELASRVTWGPPWSAQMLSHCPTLNSWTWVRSGSSTRKSLKSCRATMSNLWRRRSKSSRRKTNFANRCKETCHANQLNLSKIVRIGKMTRMTVPCPQPNPSCRRSRAKPARLSQALELAKRTLMQLTWVW